MTVKLISFGFKYGEPDRLDKVIDCRSMKNPHNVTELRNMTGMDSKVQKYVETDVHFGLIQNAATVAVKDGQTIAFGCYGGRHRSVAMVEMAAIKIKAKGHDVEIYHRELDVRKAG